MESSENPAGLVNWAVALDATGQDQALLDELVTVFLDEGPSLLRDIHTSLDKGDSVLLRRAAHTLKGSLRIFEATQGVALASQLESQGQNNELQGADSVLKDLDAYMARILAELRAHAES